MTSTNTKLLLASTALVSAITVAGVAQAADTTIAPGGIGGDEAASFTHSTDANSDGNIDSGDVVQTNAAIADLGAGNSIVVSTAGATVDISHSITGNAAAAAPLLDITGTYNTITVQAGDTLTQSQANAAADGILLTGNGNTVTVAGTITTNAAADSIALAGDVSSTINIQSTGNVGTIDLDLATTAANTQTITVAGTAGNITATGGAAVNATVSGSGAAITTGAADDTLTVSGSLSGAVDLAAGDDTMTVTGTITTVDTGTGINSLTVNGGTTGAITAAGTDTITLTGNDTDIGGLIDASTGTSATVVITGGATSASQTEIDGFTGAAAGAADDTFTVNSGWVNSSAALTNVETVNINGGNVTLDSIAGTETADLTVANGATLNITGVSVVDTSSTVAGTATFTGALTGGADTNVTGTMNFGAAAHTIGDLFVSGKGRANIAIGGTLNVDTVDNIDKVVISVDGDGGGTGVDSGAFVTGGALDFTSKQIKISAAQGYDLNLLDGDTFADIASGGSAATSTTSGNIVTSNGLLQYTWSIDGDANDYDLQIDLATAGVTTLAGAATGGNNKGVADSVDSSALASLYTEILASDNVDTALESLTPDVSGGAGAASINTSVASAGTVSNRLALLRGTDNGRSGMVAGEHMMANREMWLQAFGTNVEQDERKGVKGFDATTGGFAIGVDTDEIVHGGRVGVAFAYAKADVDSDQANNAQTDIDTYQLTAYGSKDLANDMYVDGMISYAFNEHEGSRTDFLNDTYTADYDGNQFSVKGEVGKSYDWANTRVTPNFGLHYIMVETDDYTETGSGANGQSVDTDNQSALLVSLGADMEWNITGRDGSEYMPYLRAKYSYDAIGDEVETTSTFLGGGTAFTAQGADIARHSLGLGAGVNVVTTAGFEFTAGYDAEVKEDFLAHTGMLQARWSF